MEVASPSGSLFVGRELYEPCVAARPEGCSPVVPVHNHNHDDAP